PVTATVGGQSVAGPGPPPTIRITDSDLFADPPPTFSAENFEQFLNFSLLTPQSGIGLLDQLGSWLDQFRDTSVFQVKVPFTGLTLGKLLDLRQAFLARVRPLLESSPGTPSFNTAQELAEQLVGLIGGDPTAVHYDPTTHLLTYRIQFTETFSSPQTDLNFDASLGSVANIQSDTKLNVSAGVRLNLTFGVDLSPLQPDTTPSDPSDDDSVARHFF